VEITINSKYNMGDAVYLIESRDHIIEEVCSKCDGQHAKFPNGKTIRCDECLGTGKRTRKIGVIHSVLKAEAEVIGISAHHTAGENKTKIRYRIRHSRKIEGKWTTSEGVFAQHQVFTYEGAQAEVTKRNQQILDFPLDES